MINSGVNCLLPSVLLQQKFASQKCRITPRGSKTYLGGFDAPEKKEKVQSRTRAEGAEAVERSKPLRREMRQKKLRYDTTFCTPSKENPNKQSSQPQFRVSDTELSYGDCLGEATHIVPVNSIVGYHPS